MGNLTHFSKCFSNKSVDEPCIDIIRLLIKWYKQNSSWFADWMDQRLTEEQRALVAKLEELDDEIKCRALLESDPTFPRFISMNDAMLMMFDDIKLYGYMERTDVSNFVNAFESCIPADRSMVMIGTYEGYGPIAFCWKTGSKNRLFTMNAHKHWQFSDVDLLLLDKMPSKEEYVNQVDEEERGEYSVEYDHAVEFRSEVLDVMAKTDWSTRDIAKWLNRHGFMFDRSIGWPLPL